MGHHMKRVADHWARPSAPSSEPAQPRGEPLFFGPRERMQKSRRGRARQAESGGIWLVNGQSRGKSRFLRSPYPSNFSNSGSVTSVSYLDTIVNV